MKARGANAMKTRSLFIAGLLALIAPSVLSADTIGSKVEYQGEPENVQVTGIQARERNGLLALQVELTNKNNDPQRIFYRLKWLDETGFQVWDDEPWKPVLVHGKQKQNLLAVAPTKQARDFRVQFHEARESGNKSDSPPAGQPNN